MAGRLDGKVAVVTGGCSGIGLATVNRFVEEGARVVIGDIDDQRGHELVGQLGGEEFATYVHVDVTSKDEVDALFQSAKDTYGSVDIAFNNAGISPPEDDSIMDTDLDVWRRVQEVNLTSVYLCCKAALGHMLEQRSGSIINTASFVAVMGAATSQISYSASKGGVLSMSRELGVQFAREGIRVNALCPGPVNTPLLKELFASDAERAARRLVHVPMGRFGEPEEMANAVLFLASDESSFMTASTFLVDGGISGAYVTPAVSPRRATADRADHLPRAGEVGRVGPARRPAAGDVRRRDRPRGRRTRAAAAGHRRPRRRGRRGRPHRRAGGQRWADVDPDRYGEEPHPRTVSWRPDRDAWEIALLTSAAAGEPADARCVPWDAGDGGRRRRDPRPAHAGPGRPRASTVPVADEFGEIEVLDHAGVSAALDPRSAVTVHCHHHQSVRSHPGFEPVAGPRTGRWRRWRPKGSASASPSSGTRSRAATSGSSTRWSRAASPGSLKWSDCNAETSSRDVSQRAAKASGSPCLAVLAAEEAAVVARELGHRRSRAPRRPSGRLARPSARRTPRRRPAQRSPRAARASRSGS